MVMEAAGSAATAIGEALGIVKPDKAKLKVVGDNKPDSGPEEIEFMFNPAEYSISQPVTIDPNPTPAVAGGKPEYGGAGPMTIGLTMFLDDFASAKGDVTPKVTTLLNWTKPTKKSLVEPSCPAAPLVRFVWGGNPQLDTFEGFISSLNITYLIFRKDGRPVQAKVIIAIQGRQVPPKSTNPTSHAMNSRRIHNTVEGDTLQSIAFEELGKPAYWRAIADLNGIDDPLRIEPGTPLLIPTAADAARTS